MICDAARLARQCVLNQVLPDNSQPVRWVPGAFLNVALPPMLLAEEVVADYQTTRLSLKAHPMQFLRATLAQDGVLTCADANAAPAKPGAATAATEATAP